MKSLTNIVFALILSLVSLNIGGQSQPNTYIIEDVQYLDFDRGSFVLGNVKISGNQIEAVGQNIENTGVDSIINGEGQYLIPGLVDAHIHLFQSGGLYTRPDVIDLTAYKPYEEEQQWLRDNAGNILKRYLAAGITSLYDVGGPLSNFELRNQYKDDKNYPHLYITGPLVSTYQPPAFSMEDSPIIKVNSTEEARALVQKQIPLNADFIKIWYIAFPGQTAESTYDIIKATIEESHDNGLPVAVHATELNTAKLAIKAGADILVHSVQNPIDDEFIDMLNNSNVSYVPTLMVHGQYDQVLTMSYNPTAEDYHYSPPIPLGHLNDSEHLTDVPAFKQYNAFKDQMMARVQIADSVRAVNLKMLQEAQANIVTGTDAGNIGTMHVSSYFEELRRMQNAGLSPLEILSASTKNAQGMISAHKNKGEIKPGYAADLVLLNNNPLNDIDALKSIDIVIKSGKIHSPDALVELTPEDLAQMQLNAYNNGDIDAFLDVYSDDIKIYNFPNELSFEGKENMRQRYGPMFDQLPDLHCELRNRTIMGNTVIDHERITGIPGQEAFEAIAIYKIVKEKISEVYFMR